MSPLPAEDFPSQAQARRDRLRPYGIDPLKPYPHLRVGTKVRTLRDLSHITQGIVSGMEGEVVYAAQEIRDNGPEREDPDTGEITFGTLIEGIGPLVLFSTGGVLNIYNGDVEVIA